MTYEIARMGAKFVVRKKGGGKIMGRHMNRKKAMKQMAALMASEKGMSSEHDKMMK